MFRGIITALITPMRDGRVDEQAFADFVEWQIGEGVHGLVPCGTTGESPTLSHEEHDRVIGLCIEVAKKRVPVIAGTGSNATSEAIRLTKAAQKAGADAALVVTPYYNKPNQRGLYAHFKAIHDATDIPVIIYNIPGRSVINLTDDTLSELAKLPRIAGIKDATGDLARVATLRKKAGAAFCQLSGEDMTAVGFNAMGGQGCISVTSNIVPKLCAEMQEATLSGDYAKALEIQDRLVPLHSVLFCDTSPQPVKYAASLLGKCAPDLRLPLLEPEDAVKVRVREAMSGVFGRSF